MRFSFIPNGLVWQQFVSRLFVADRGRPCSPVSGFKTVAAERLRDYGLDGIDADPTGTIYQMYFPLWEQSEPRYKRVNSKLNETCRKLEDNATEIKEIIGSPVKRLVLIIPEDPDVKIRERERELEKEYSINIDIWGETEVSEMLSRHPSTVRDLIPFLTYSADIERILEEATKFTNRRQPLYQRFIGWETAATVNQLLRDSTSLFVGRETELQRLNNFVTEQACGYLTVTAQAGFGKTALLSNWILRNQGSFFISYHFFSNRYKDLTCPVALGLRNLLRQVHLYYELHDEPLPNEEGLIRDALYGLLQTRGANPDKPLIIILDGLDEAEHSIYPPFPYTLPPGVFVIASARASEAEDVEYLQGWTETATLLHLDRLDRKAIISWLEQAGSGELKSFIKETLIDEIVEKTKGFPLYLQFLSDELIASVKAGGSVVDEVHQTPRGFGKYVEKQWRLLAKQVEGVSDQHKIQELVSLLAVADGPLMAEDIQDLTGLTSWDLLNLPWKVSRWLIFREEEGMYTYAFSHSLLRDEFERVLGKQAGEVRERLIQYCARWQEHLSIYALQYYASHLLEANRLTDLSNVARDEAFREAQSSAFPADFDLPLRTVRTALQGASSIDNAPEMAEFILAHAKLAAKNELKETPVHALKTSGVATALTLAENYDDPVPVLWKLIIALLLILDGEKDEADKIVRRITVETKSKLVSWMGDVAVVILSYLGDLAEEVILNAANTILDDYGLRRLAVYFAQRGSKLQPLALRVMECISEDNKDKAISVVARALAEAGNWEESLQSLQRIKDPFDLAWAFSDLSAVALEQNELAKAESLIWEIEVLQDRITQSEGKNEVKWQLCKSLSNMVVFLFKEKRLKAPHLLSIIIETASSSQRLRFRASILSELGLAYALTEEQELAISTFQEAVEIARIIRLPREAARVLAYIGRAYSKAKMPEQALSAYSNALSYITDISDRKIRTEILGELAADYAYEGDVNTAISILLNNSSLTGWALADVARALVQRGDIETAKDLTKNRHYKVSAYTLAEIGVSQLNRGLLDDGITTLTEALGIMRIIHPMAPNLPTVQALANIARAYFDLGKPNEAQKILDIAMSVAVTSKRLNVRIWHLIDIAKAIERTEPIEVVESILYRAYSETKTMRGSYVKSWLQAEIALTMNKLGFIEWANELLIEAEPEALSIEDSTEKTKALCELVEASALIGNLEHSKELLEKAHEVAVNIKLSGVRIEALAYIAFTCAKAEMAEEGRNLLEITKVAKHRDGLKARALLYASEGNIGRAIEEARKLPDAKNQAQTMRYIAISEIRNRRILNAMRIVKILISLRASDPHPIEIPRITRAIAEAKDYNNFKRILSYNAYRYGSAYAMIGLLARVYPTHITALEAYLLKSLESFLTINAKGSE